MAKARNNWRRGMTPEERRADSDALRAADAYNAGWRRGSRGQAAVSDRYGSHPRFQVGYDEGVAWAAQQ